MIWTVHTEFLFEPPGGQTGLSFISTSTQKVRKRIFNDLGVIWGADKFHSATEINIALNNNYLSVFEFLGTNTVCN